LHLTADGRTLMAVSQLAVYTQEQMEEGKKRTLHTWDLATGKRLPARTLAASMPWEDSFINEFSPDGRLFAFTTGSVYDLAAGKELFRLSVEGKAVGGPLGGPLAFSRDGALLAMGVWESPDVPQFKMLAVQVWELATLQPVRRIETGPVGRLAFTPDGRRLVVAGRESLRLWDLATGQVVASRPAPGHYSYGESFASSLALAADGRTIATGHADTTVLLWDLAAPRPDRPAAPLPAAELGSYWADLAETDAGKALAAISRLADVPEQATALLRDRLRPAQAVPADEMRRLIADLDADEFARREAVVKRLAELGELADAALREALRGQPSPEARRRIEALLAEPPTVRLPEARRGLRAVRLLESIGTPEARRVLERLAGGIPEARLTREAKAALGRLPR
jgi:hypothetical protein